MFEANWSHNPQFQHQHVYGCGVHLALFADDTCLYETKCKEDYVLRKLQHGLNSVAEWFKHGNIKINEDKTQAITLIKLDYLGLSLH
jgi:hypothetical protein